MQHIYWLRGWLVGIGLLLGAVLTAQAQCPAAAGCTPGPASAPSAAAFGMGIYNVTLGTLNNTTAGVTDGYQDYSCTTGTTLSPGASYPISIRTNANADENVRVWLDLNNDGQFNPATELLFSSSNARLHTGTTAVIPATAVLGQPLRLRVAADAATSPVPTPCSTPQYSQTEDYRVTLQANTQKPAPAFAVGTAGACAGTYTFQDQSTQGPTSWRWSFGDGTFSTQQHPSHTYAQPGTYDVRLRVCNTNGCDSLLKPGYVTYLGGGALVAATCTPQTTGYCCGFGITQVSFAGQTQASANGAAGYEDFTCQRRFTVQQGQRYPLRITTGNTAAHHVVVYIDYDGNGSFTGADELVFDMDNAVSPDTAISIAGGGLTNVPLRLRVITDAGGTALTACTNPVLGQVEDYSVVVTPSACTGLPAVLPALQGVFAVCAGQRALLQLSTALPGVSLQWQSSPDSLVWTSTLGATTATYQPPAATGAAYYRVRATCGPAVRFSRAYRVDTLPAVLCNYCWSGPATNTCNSSARLGRVWIPQTTLDVPTRPCTMAPDSASHLLPVFPSNQTALLQQGATYQINAQALGNSAGYGIYLWIDYNRNGQFELAERTPLSTTTATAPTWTALLPIPATALTGITRARLWLGYAAFTPCRSAGAPPYQEILDFFVTISPPQCSTPLAGGRVSGPATYCPGTVPTMSVLFQSPGAALQWQTSPDSLTWTDRTGATARVMSGGAPLYDSLYVRVRVSCGTAVAYSAAVRVVPDPQLCYCTPSSTNTPSPYDQLALFQIGNAALTSVAQAPAYTYYPPATAANTATLLTGVSYPVYTDLPLLNIYRPGTTVWIDYNRDGQFTADEATVVGDGADPRSLLTATLTVPPNARPGTTRMRVLSRHYNRLRTPQAQCSSQPGELRDYIITLAPPPAPVLPLTAGTVTGGTAVCNGQPVRLVASGYSPAAKLQWQQQVGSSWQNLPAATAAVLYSPPVTAATAFRVQATVGTASAVSAAYGVTNTAPCPCTTNLGGFQMQGTLRSFILSGPGAYLSHYTNTLRAPNANGDVYTNNGGQHDSLHTTLIAGQPYRASIWSYSSSASSTANQTALWLDYNRNGQFEPSELVGNTATIALGQVNIFFTVPATLTPGPLRLRVRTAERQPEPLGASNACTRYTYSGETADYEVTVAAAPPFQAPEITFSGAATAGGTVQLGTRVALPAGTTYQWEGPLGFTSTLVQPTLAGLTAAHSGYYLLTVRSSTGYQLTAARYLSITSSLPSTQQRVPSTLSIFPNPTTGLCTLRVPAGGPRPTRLRLHTATGQLVHEQAVTSRSTADAQEVPLDLRRLPRGLYFVELQTGQGSQYGKVVVE